MKWTTVCRRFIRLFPLMFIIYSGVAMRMGNLQSVRLYTLDEQVYGSMAQVYSQSGLVGLSHLADHYISDPRRLAVPSPVRVGYVSILALRHQASTVYETIAFGAELSTFCDACSMVFISLWAYWSGKLNIAYAVVTMFAFSPTLMAMARRCWEESLIVLFGSVLICLSWTQIKRPTFTVSVIIGSLAGVQLIYKEISFASTIWIVVSAIIVLHRNAFDRQAAAMIAALTSAIVLSITILSTITGSLGHTLWFFLKNIDIAGSTLYAARYQSAPWYLWLKAILSFDPILSAGISLGVLAPFVMNAKSPTARFMQLVVVGDLFIIMLIIFGHNRLNLRFMAPIIPSLFVSAGIGYDGLAQRLRRPIETVDNRIRASFMVLLCCTIMFLGYSNYEKLALENDLRDLAYGLIAR